MKTKNAILMTLTLAVVLFTNMLNAQDSDSKIYVSKVVDISTDKMWQVLRQMDDIDKYSSIIDKVTWSGEHGVGGERVCYGPDGNVFVKENIVKFDDATRSYSYAVMEGAPAKDMVNSFKVIDLGYNKSMAIWSTKYSTFIQNPRFTENQFRGGAQQGFDDFINKVAQAAMKL